MLEWIAAHAAGARANRAVIDDGAQCVLAASADARVDASLTQTSSAELAIRIPQALRSTAGVVVAVLIGARIADGDSVAVRITRASEVAWRWLTRSGRCVCDRRNGQTVDEGVAHEPVAAVAVRRVIEDATVGIDAARRRLARFLAARIDARLIAGTV